jgi:tetratricopeptide (TPR) repeat protein
LLDTKPIEFVQNKKEKADLLYLRGKSLDYLPEYSKGAEEFLSKAIKLLPSKYEAWDALGHTYWKKRDLPGARKCFEGSLEQNQNNKDALRHLSMVLRMIDEPNAEIKRKNYQDSIQLANKSVALDLGDSQSWYVLGNAHLTNFFVNNDSVGELTLALKAYT